MIGSTGSSSASILAPAIAPRTPVFSVLASGSAANATVVVGRRSFLLIDCGLSARELEKRLHAVGVSGLPCAGIVVTHEHGDHVRGLYAFATKRGCPVYLTAGTESELRRGNPRLDKLMHLTPILSGERCQIDEFTILPFAVLHDAAEPVGLVVTDSSGRTLGIATDLGKVTHIVREALRGVDALIVEANHDRDLLMECRYPWHVKQRIASSYGHLSNDDAAALVSEIAHPGLTRVVLGHLSIESNTPDHALRAVSAVWGRSGTLHCGGKLPV